MTVTLHITDIITAISGISVSGLVVADLDEIPASADVRTSLLVPSPGEPSFVSNFALERVTTGMSLAGMDATYTLNYKFLYLPVGATRGLYDLYPGMVAMAADIIEAIANLTTLNGAVTWKPLLGEFVVITDPTGTDWDGCLITIEVLDFIQ
jgi:hypothetical protein